MLLIVKAFLRPARSTTIFLLLVASWLLVAVLGLAPSLLASLGSQLPAPHGSYVELSTNPCNDCVRACLAECRAIIRGESFSAIVVASERGVYAYPISPYAAWSLARGLVISCNGSIITGPWRPLGPNTLYSPRGLRVTRCSQWLWLSTSTRSTIAHRALYAVSHSLGEGVERAATLLSMFMGLVVLVAETYNVLGACQLPRVLVYEGVPWARTTILAWLGLLAHSYLSVLVALGLAEMLVHATLWLLSELYGYITPPVPLAPSNKVLASMLLSGLLGSLGASLLGVRLCAKNSTRSA